MGIYLNPRNTGFEEISGSSIYIDKSELISQTNSRIATPQKYICVSRPRRFGKSVTANMLSAYYSRECDSKHLFDSLKIASDPSYEKHLNRYDVIFLNMQDFLNETNNVSDMISLIEKELLYELREIYENFMREDETSLMRALNRIFSKTDSGFIFIIDEWDSVIREYKYDSEAYKKYLKFLQSLLKDHSYVKLAYMTGILPIKKYGIHSALNMFNEYSMTNPKIFAPYTGFLQDEVQQLCEQYGMDFEETKRWYDGYRVAGDLHVYNPRSVVSAMLDKEFQSYWVNTETYEALKVYIEMNLDGLKDAVIAMMAGDEIFINTRTFANDMTSMNNKDDVLTLLVHLGYLTYNPTTGKVKIPNEEVKREFYDVVSNMNWVEISDAIKASDELLENTLRRNEAAVAAAIDDVHMDLTSILQYNNETALSCVISMAYYSSRRYYTTVREMPAGKGFADIVFIPHKNTDKPAMIVELKWDKSAETAINQIKEKRYCKALEHYAGNVLLVGINYDRESKTHECVIESIEL